MEKPQNFTEQDLVDLAQTWVAQLRKIDDERDKDVEQAVVAVSFLASHDKQWRFVRAAISAAESDDELAAIAAGPLEHILGWHGETYIERVEQECLRNAHFVRALSFVWRYRMSDEVWERVQRLKSQLS